ncbi:MAG TPA: S-layer homology domain-containing protein [Candidatus Limnocylindrales bacterium]|nr:S-layer homology domain-containing protein [Candidatus Limnocylindrales bacterium]
MIRRFGAALIGLALILPMAVSSVAAHTSAGVVATQVDEWTDGAGDTHVTGLLTNHTGSRQSNIQVTATWTSPAASETATAMVSNLAPHASAPFAIVEEDTDVSAGTGLAVTATGTGSSTKPTGGLHIDLDTESLVGDVYTVSVTNDSNVLGDNIVVYALTTGGTNNDAAASPAQDLAAGATANFVVTFNALQNGTAVTGVTAKTTAGTFLASWNNYFSDLGASSFLDEIAYLADTGITLGCGAAIFCPGSAVTREQMAVFIDRAVVFANEAAPDQGFTDIGSLSVEAKQAINNLALAGVTGGCTVTPKQYCPSQNVTRGQMSKFLFEAYDLPAAAGTFIDSFTDDDGHFSAPYNDAMKQAGITSGCTATTFCPNINVTRAQMARFLFVAEGN